MTVLTYMICQNCKAVLVECRLGTGGSVVALENFNDYEDFNFKQKDPRDIYETTHYGNSIVLMINCLLHTQVVR